MKKLSILALGALMVIAFAGPASAFDNEFGGYMRTRAYSQSDFSGDDTGAQDLTQVDTRTRLSYTAIFSEDFKFVNRFEWNSVWGDEVGGDIGTDGMGIFRIKHSYANFNVGSLNFLVGMQPRILARGFIFDDDFAGVALTYNAEGFSFPFIWMKAYEGGMGKDANDQDVDYYALKPTFNVSETMTLTPFLLYITSEDGSQWDGTSMNQKVGVSFLGVDLDMKFERLSVWFTGIYESGEVDMTAAAVALGYPASVDVAASLLALGATYDMGPLDIHGQVFTATGDDNWTDSDAKAFYVPYNGGQYYYWSEIMGWGIFDNQASKGSCATQITNILAFNVGIGYRVSDKLKITADLWNASLAEKDTAGNDDLGTEIDLVLTYALTENLNLDVVAAYLSAGDATGTGDEDPVEIGTQLSFRF